MRAVGVARVGVAVEIFVIALPPSHVVNIYNHNHHAHGLGWPILMAVAISASTSSAPTSGCTICKSSIGRRHRRQQPAVHDKGRGRPQLQEQEEEEEEEEDLSEDSIAAATVSHSVKITKASQPAPKGAKRQKGQKEAAPYGCAGWS